MKKRIRLTESELINIIKRVLKEQTEQLPDPFKIVDCLQKNGITIPQSCIGSFFPVPTPPDPNKCMNDVIRQVGSKKAQIEQCIGMVLTPPVMK